MYDNAVLCLVIQSCSTLCDPMDCSLPGSSVHGDSPGKNTGVSCHSLLQQIFPTQGLNPGLLHCRWIFLTIWATREFSSVQSLSRVWLFATLWTAARQASLSITNSQSLFKFMSIESVMPSNHLIFCCPLLLLPSVLPNSSLCNVSSIRWSNYWSFSISLSNEYSRLISFRID